MTSLEWQYITLSTRGFGGGAWVGLGVGTTYLPPTCATREKVGGTAQREKPKEVSEALGGKYQGGEAQ